MKSPAPASVNDEAELEAIPVVPPSSSRTRTGSSGSGAAGAVAPGVPSPEPGESLAACLERCASADLSEDNRATCRLLCESHHGPKTSKSNDALLNRFFGCFDACSGQSCQVGCASKGDAPACKQTCVETLARCLPACASQTAEGTCSERCETAARRCLAGC